MQYFLELNDSFDARILSIFIQKTYGKLMLAGEFLVVGVLQLEILSGNLYGQAACLVLGMVFIKLAHRATRSGISKAAQIEYAIKQKNRIRDAHRQKIARILRRAAIARVVAQSAAYCSAIKTIVAAELHVRSIVKSVLCTVTDTLTPKLFPCPPSVCA